MVVILYLWSFSLFKQSRILDWSKRLWQSNLRALVCVADFNDIRFASDRKGVTRRSGQSKCFHNWVSDFALIDLPLSNIKHTWSDFRVNASCSKIDSLCIKGMAGITPENPPRRASKTSFWPLPINGWHGQLNWRSNRDARTCGINITLSSSQFNHGGLMHQLMAAQQKDSNETPNHQKSI